MALTLSKTIRTLALSLLQVKIVERKRIEYLRRLTKKERGKVLRARPMRHRARVHAIIGKDQLLASRKVRER